MKLLDYLFAARLPLLIPVWSIFLVSLHYHHQLAQKSFSLENLLILISITMLAAGAYYINQVYDAESDALNKKVLFLERGVVNTRTLMMLFILLSILPLGYAVFYPKSTLFIFAQFIVLSYCYSAPPLRLKDRPIGGLLANSWAFGFLIPFSIMPDMNQHNMGLMGWDNPFYFFLSVMGVHILTTIPDAKGDKSTGKKTIATIYPVRVAILLAFFAFTGAAFVAFKSEFPLLIIIAVISATITLITAILPKISFVLMSTKLPILFITLLAGYFYPVYILFIVVLILATRAYYKKRFNLTYPKLT